MLKDGCSIRESLVHFGYQYAWTNFNIMVRFHHTFDWLQAPDSIIGKTTPKHFLFWMFDGLLHVFWSHLYSNRSSDMLETLTLNKKMTFAAEDHFTPVLCCTVFSTSLSNCSVSSSLFPLKVVFSLVVELVVRLPEPLPNSSVWNAYPNVLHFFDCLGFFLLALSTFSSRSVVFRFLPHLVGLPSWLRCSLLRCGSSFGSL